LLLNFAVDFLLARPALSTACTASLCRAAPRRVLPAVARRRAGPSARGDAPTPTLQPAVTPSLRRGATRRPSRRQAARRPGRSPVLHYLQFFTFQRYAVSLLNIFLFIFSRTLLAGSILILYHFKDRSTSRATASRYTLFL